MRPLLRPLRYTPGMSDKKRGLGRGLEALLGEARKRPEPDVPPAREQLMQIPVDLLARGKFFVHQSGKGSAAAS